MYLISICFRIVFQFFSSTQISKDDGINANKKRITSFVTLIL